MPTYLHQCTTCNHEWEDIYSISADPPTICPKCNAETVKRLIASNTPGKVELSGHEYKEKVLADAQKYKQEFMTNEKVRANFYGDSQYNSTVTTKEKTSNELKSVFRRVGTKK